jgi:RNA polymerase sigma-70 factor (ECF subfamily)
MTAAYLFSADFSESIDRSRSSSRTVSDPPAEPSSAAERILLARLQAGDESAFAELFVAHTENMYRVATALLDSHDRAADTVQAVMYRLWVQRETLEIRGSIGAYLRSATINTARNAIRDAKRAQTRAELAATSLGTIVEPSDEGDDELVERRIAVLEDAITKLPNRTREIFLLWWAGELSYAEIAGAVGISVKGVERARARALETLRAALIAAGLGPTSQK